VDRIAWTPIEHWIAFEHGADGHPVAPEDVWIVVLAETSEDAGNAIGRHMIVRQVSPETRARYDRVVFEKPWPLSSDDPRAQDAIEPEVPVFSGFD
jgi:hypothetical protein